MRFVVFSDLHLHEWNYGSTIIEGRNSRLEQQVRVVKDIQAYCEVNGITTAFFCGDLYHQHTITPAVSQASLESFYGFHRRGISLHLIPGNHDQFDRSGRIHSLSWFRTLGVLHEFDEDANVSGIPCHFIPHTTSATALNERLHLCGQGLIFLHQGVSGVEVNSKGFTLDEALKPEMIPETVAMAFAGHYHTFNQVSHNLIIPGSTMQLNWGDEGEPRGWLDVTMEDGIVTDVKLIQSSASRFVTIDEGDLDSDISSELYNNFVRVMSGGDFSPEELSSAVMAAGAVSCEIKPKISKEKHTRIELAKLASFNEVIYAFASKKEKLGVITEHDKEVGERLLKESYSIPQV